MGASAEAAHSDVHPAHSPGQVSDLASALGPTHPLVVRRMRGKAAQPTGEAAVRTFEQLEGQRMVATMTAPCPHTAFARWANADHEQPLILGREFSLNCGESVLVAAYQAKLVTWKEIHDWYHSAWHDDCGDDDDKSRAWSFYRQWTPGTLKAYGEQKPAAGDLVYLFATDGTTALDGTEAMDHVMMATGRVVNGETEVMSFNYGKDISLVQRTTVEQLLREETDCHMRRIHGDDHEYWERKSPEERERNHMKPTWEEEFERRKAMIHLPQVKFATPTWNQKPARRR